MSRSTVIGLVSFAVSLVLGLVVVGAVRTEVETIGGPAAGNTIEIPTADGGVLVVDERRVTVSADDPDDPDQRPAGPEDGAPEGVGAGGNAVDEAVAAAEDALGADGLLVPGVPLDLEPLDGFIDACLEDPEDCPVGIGAVVLDPVRVEGPPLSIAASYAPNGSEYLDSCQAEFVPDAHNVVVYSSNPIAVDLLYEDHFNDIEFTAFDPGPQPGDATYRRWEGLRDSGELLDLVPADQVVWCIPLLGVEEATDRASRWNVTRLTGTDPLGQVAELQYWVGFDIGRTDWPPAVMGRGPELLLRVGVWERVGAVVDDTYRGFAWPIEYTANAEGCPDVEQRLISSTSTSVARLFWEHPEMDYNFAPVTLNETIRPSPLYSGNWNLRQFAMPLREGRQYLMCLWELKRGARSFDTWEVINRESRWVTTPNLHNLDVTGSVQVLDDPSGPLSVTALVAGPTRYCRLYTHSGTAEGLSTAGTYPLVGHNPNNPDPTSLCQSVGLGYDDTIIVTPLVRFDADGDGISETVTYGDPHAVVLDTRQDCDFSGDGQGCVGSRSEVHRFAFVDSDCDPCLDTALQIVIEVDYLQSRGGGSGILAIGDFAEFEAAEPAPAEGGPQIDENAIEFGPVPGTSDSLFLRLETDRVAEVTVELVPHETDVRGHRCDRPGVRLTSGQARQHSFVFSNLCAATHYFPELTVTDATGESNVFNGSWISGLRSKRPNGYSSNIAVTVTAIEIDRSVVEAECRQSADAHRWNDDLPDPYDPFCIRFARWMPYSRTLADRVSLGNPEHWDYCLGPNAAAADEAGEVVEYRVRPHPNDLFYHTDVVAVTVSYAFQQLVDCGLPFVNDTGWDAFEITMLSSIEDLRGGVSATHTSRGITWEVVATATATSVFDEDGEYFNLLGP